MIRHITFSSLFVEMKKDGYLRPSYKNIYARGNVAFERDWHGDAYFKATFIAKKSMPGFSFSPDDLIALIFDEQDLLVKGYELNDGMDFDKSSYKYELESMLNKGEITNKEYKEIGSIVYIKGEIPLDYMVNVDIPDKKRLARLGLT